MEKIHSDISNIPKYQRKSNAIRNGINQCEQSSFHGSNKLRIKLEVVLACKPGPSSIQNIRGKKKMGNPIPVLDFHNMESRRDRGNKNGCTTEF
jgi:hypothetical protein